MSEPKKFTVKKKKLGSYPYLSVVLSMTLALFVIGVFGTLVIYSKELEKMVRENVKIQVYLKNQISDTQKNQIEKSIASKSYLATGENPIQFISRDEAAKQFIKETGEDFNKFLGENPLRDAYLIRIEEDYHETDSLKKIKAEVEKISGVFEVYYVENVIDSINKNVTKIGIILMSLVALLLVIVVLLINNTLRLALFSQRFLIRSMQLVGAKRGFIKKPFLIRSVIHGLTSGIIASGLLVLLIGVATKKVNDLAVLQNNNKLILLFIALLGLGIIIAFTSTFRSVSKYLNLSLDELY